VEQTITYQVESDLHANEFIDVLERSGLAARRPVNDVERMDKMLREADIIVTARAGGRLVGVSRAISDFAFCTYLSDLAVDAPFQRQGIGQALVHRTHEAAGRHTHLLLVAAPTAEGYYGHIGMEQHPSCWFLRGQ